MTTLLAWFGLGGVSIAGLLAAAYFSPVFKKYFLFGAGVVAVVLFVYGKGVHDEKVKRDAAEKATVDTVGRAVNDAKTSTKKDPFDDPRN